MKRAIPILVILALFINHCGQSQEISPGTRVGIIHEIKVDSLPKCTFSGKIYFTPGLISVNYWRPGRLNRDKTLLLPVEKVQEKEGDIVYSLDDFGNSHLFKSGNLHIEQNSKEFTLRLWNRETRFVYYGVME